MFTAEELVQIEQNGLDPVKVEALIAMFPWSLDTAIGYLVQLKGGLGQERNEPYAEEAVAEAGEEVVSSDEKLPEEETENT